jgi:hypothetical protein
MATVSDYLANKILDKVLRAVDFTTGPVYVSLHSSNPGITGTTEITGGSYSRKQVSTAGWNAAASRLADNISAIAFASMPACVIRYIGLWDAASNGNFLTAGPASPASVSVASGDSFNINAGRLDVTFV